jgi:dissimilatory sulfite reductase (desulfoviridin) alpha/beta subunit
LALLRPTAVIQPIALEHQPSRRYRCRYCGALLPAWLKAAREPDGALLLGHLSQQHPDRVGAYLARMHTTDEITRVVLEAYEEVDADEDSPPARGTL